MQFGDEYGGGDTNAARSSMVAPESNSDAFISWKFSMRARGGRESVAGETTKKCTLQRYDTFLRMLIALPNSLVCRVHAIVPVQNSKVRRVLHLAASKVAEDVLLDDRELRVVAGGLQVVEEVVGASPRVGEIHVDVLETAKNKRGNSTG